MEMGLITPPVGLNLCVVQGGSLRRAALAHIIAGALPYVFLPGLVAVFPGLGSFLLASIR